MKIAGLSRVEWRDTELLIAQQSIAYDSIESIYFIAVVTQNKVSGISVGKSYQAELRLRCADSWIEIKPDTRMFGGLGQAGFEALHKAYGILAEMTFTNRVETYESQVAQRNYFDVAGVQFHRNGHVFDQGREVGNLRDPQLALCLSPFELAGVRKKASPWERPRTPLGARDFTIPLTIDKDCILYLVRSLYGITFPEKRLSRHRIFYEAVLRFGAVLAKADGRVDAREITQLKRFFRLDEQALPDAGRIFKNEVAARSAPSDILAAFGDAFADANEVKEGFVFGMLLVALADGQLHRAEFDLIQSAATFLGLGDAAFARVLAAAGVDPNGFVGDDAGAAQGSRAAYLRILGLEGDPSPHQIQQAYKRLIKRYHPDVLRGQGMLEDEIAKAGQLLATINTAYAALR